MSAKNDSQKQFEHYVSEIAGDSAVKIVRSIGDGATDEKIEQATKLKIAEIRSLLNVLHNHGIVEYTREKNMSSGWFTYTWKVNMNRAMINFLTSKRKECEEIRSKLWQNNGGDSALIYKCPKGCTQRMFFEDAAEHDFACPHCATKLKFSDGSKELRELEHKLTAIESILASSIHLA